MKSKKFNKVLTLKKSTVINLDSNKMYAVKGGYFNTDFDISCQSWCGCQTNFYHCPETRDFCP